MNSTTDSPKRRVLGLLGALWAPTRDGHESPTDEEIAALFDGRLTPSRATQVRAQLAHCPDGYRSLIHLTEVADIADAAAAPARPHPYRGRITLMGGLGVAAAALLATVTLLLDSPDRTLSLDDSYLALSQAVSSGRYRPSQTGWIWRAGYGSRNLGAPETARSTAAQTALTVGVARGLEQSTSSLEDWLEVRSDLGAVKMRCGELPAGECERIRSLYEEVGRWAVLMHFACEPLQSGDSQSDSDGAWTEPQFWQEAGTSLARIAEESARLTPDGPYARLFENWNARTDPADPATLCRGVPPLLSTMGR